MARAAFRSIGAHSTEGEVRVERGGGGEGEGEEVVLNNNLAVADRMLPDQVSLVDQPLVGVVVVGLHHPPPTSHRPTWPSAAPHFAPLPTSTISLTSSFDFGFKVRVQRSDRPSYFCQVLFRIVPAIVNRLWNLFSLGQDVDGGPQWNWFLGIYERTYVAHVYSTNTKTPSASL